MNGSTVDDEEAEWCRQLAGPQLDLTGCSLGRCSVSSGWCGCSSRCGSWVPAGLAVVAWLMWPLMWQLVAGWAGSGCWADEAAYGTADGWAGSGDLPGWQWWLGWHDNWFLAGLVWQLMWQLWAGSSGWCDVAADWTADWTADCSLAGNGGWYDCAGSWACSGGWAGCVAVVVAVAGAVAITAVVVMTADFGSLVAWTWLALPRLVVVKLVGLWFGSIEGPLEGWDRLPYPQETLVVSFESLGFWP